MAEKGQRWYVKWQHDDGEVDDCYVRGGTAASHAAVVERTGGKVIKIEKVEG